MGAKYGTVFVVDPTRFLPCGMIPQIADTVLYTPSVIEMVTNLYDVSDEDSEQAILPSAWAQNNGDEWRQFFRLEKVDFNTGAQIGFDMTLLMSHA